MDIDRHHACLAMPVSLICRGFGAGIASRMAGTPVNPTHWVAIRFNLRRGPGRTRELVDADLPGRIFEKVSVAIRCCLRELTRTAMVLPQGVTHCRSRNIYSGTFPYQKRFGTSTAAYSSRPRVGRSTSPQRGPTCC